MAKPQNGPRLIKVNESRHLVVTPKFRVSFPQLFTARSFQDAEDQKGIPALTDFLSHKTTSKKP